MTIELDCSQTSRENESVAHIRVIPQLTSFSRKTICAACRNNEPLGRTSCSANSTLFPHFDMLLRQACDGTTNCTVPISKVSMNLVCDDCDVTQSCLADCLTIAYACHQVEGNLSRFPLSTQFYPNFTNTVHVQLRLSVTMFQVKY